MGCAGSTNYLNHKSEILDIIESAPSSTIKLHSKLGSKLVINKAITPKIRRERVILKLRSDPTMKDDIKYFSSPPCVNFCKILDKLYLTSFSGITEENIMNNGIKLIVNVTFETPLIDNMEVTSLRIPIDDVLDENIYPYFELVIPIIEKVIANNYAVVFHCLVGKSRSASMVLAFLIRAKKMTLADAFKHLYACRPIIHPNITFMKALMRWEKKFHNRNTIKLVQIDFDGVRVEIPDIIINNYPKVYTSEANAQLQYFGYNREEREKMIKTGVQKTHSSLKLPSIISDDLLTSIVSDYNGENFYKRFASLVNKKESATGAIRSP